MQHETSIEANPLSRSEAGSRVQKLPVSVPSSSLDSADPAQLRIRLRDLAAGEGESGVVAGLFAALYEPFALMPVGERPGAWAAFVVAEGLRVKDLDPQPGREALRALGRALVAAGLSQTSAAAVLGISQPWFSKLVKDRPATPGVQAARPAEACESVVALSSRRTRASGKEYRKAVVAAVVAEGILEDPPVPGDSLRLAVTSIADGSRFIEEYLEGMGTGSVLGVKDEALIRRLTREVESLVAMLPNTGIRPVTVNE